MSAPASPDLTTRVGSVELPNPVMTASGTAGHGAELAPYFDLSELGAIVVKSLAADPWPGNPPPRLRPATGGMLNAVGLQGPGIPAWREEHLPALEATGARIVVSIWGRTVADYERAATLLADVGSAVVAVEVNLSCPNLERGRHLFAHDEEMTEAVMAATAPCGRPRWAKLSPNTEHLVEIASAARRGGAEAVTLVNTVLGMAVEDGRFGLGNGGGGLSGRAIHAIAVRAVHDVRAAHPDLAIVGVGGVADGADAIELLETGADAVQVGTATFFDPRAPITVLHEMGDWCRRRQVARVRDVVGSIHRNGGNG